MRCRHSLSGIRGRSGVLADPRGRCIAHHEVRDRSHAGPREGCLRACIARPCAEDSSPPSPDAGDSQPRRGRDRFTTRSLRLVPRRATAGLRWRHAGSVATRRPGRPRACISRPNHGWRLRLSSSTPDALPRTGLPGTQSAVVLGSLVRRERAPPWRALQPARHSGTPHLPRSAHRRSRSATAGPAHATAHALRSRS